MYARSICFVAIVLIALGAGSLLSETVHASDEVPMSETTAARRGLIDYVQFFTNRSERATDEISRRTDDITIKRNTVYFKTRVVPIVRQTLDRADDQAAMMDLWLYAVMVHRFVESESGVEYFGPDVDIMETALHQLEDAAQSLAKGMLTPEQFEKAERGIQEFVGGRKFEVNLTLMGNEKTQEEWTNVMTGALDKPLDVVSASFSVLPFGGGLSDTAVAVHHAAAEAGRATTTIGYLPTDMRWQTELLLLDVMQNLELPTLVASIDRMGDSASSIAKTASTLPRDVRVELTTLLEEIETRQAELQATLDGVNAVIVSTETTAQSVTGTSQALTETLTAFDGAMVTLLGTPEMRAAAAAKEDPDDSEPFDIKDYALTAERLTETATALTALLVEARAIEESPAIEATLDRIDHTLGGLVTRVYLGAGTLVLFIAIVALAYRVALSRLQLGSS